MIERGEYGIKEREEVTISQGRKKKKRTTVVLSSDFFFSPVGERGTVSHTYVRQLLTTKMEKKYY